MLPFSLQPIYCSLYSALLQQCSAAIVRFSDSSSFIQKMVYCLLCVLIKMDEAILMRTHKIPSS